MSPSILGVACCNGGPGCGWAETTLPATAVHQFVSKQTSPVALERYVEIGECSVELLKEFTAIIGVKMVDTLS